MTRFEEALQFVLSEEGVISNDPADSGKLTKWGISEVAYPQVRNPKFSRLDAVEIYRRDFWDRRQCDAFPPGFGLMLFDASVNQTQQSVRLLQQAIGASVDGIVGPETIEKAKTAGHTGLVEFAARRMAAYGMQSEFVRFGLGWSRRLMRCVARALELGEG